MTTIRDARPEDAAAWRAIVMEAALEGAGIVTTPEEVATEAQLHARFAAPGTVHLVAVEAGEVLGTLGMRRGDRPAMRHLADLGLTVAAKARGRGIGTRLMAAAEERAHASWGVEKMTLGVFAVNTRAHALYRRLGYVEEGLRRRQFVVQGRYHDEILMAKFLGGAHG